MQWTFNNQQPIYLQIVDHVKRELIIGLLTPGQQMPTVRELADQIRVNPNTVQKAMTQLEEEKLVYSQGTLGRFIINDPQLPTELRKTLVTGKVADFLVSMEELQVPAEEIISYIKLSEKEDSYEQQ